MSTHTDRRIGNPTYLDHNQILSYPAAYPPVTHGSSACKAGDLITITFIYTFPNLSGSSCIFDNAQSFRIQ